MVFTKKSVVSSFIIGGGLFLALGPASFSVLGAFATSAFIGAVGYGLYETFKDGGINLSSGFSGNDSSTYTLIGQYGSHSHNNRPTVNPPRHGWGWGGSHNTAKKTVNVRQTGSTFVPDNHAVSHVQQTGGTFVPAYKKHSNPVQTGGIGMGSNVQQTSSTFVPDTSSGSNTRLVGSTFRPSK